MDASAGRNRWKPAENWTYNKGLFCNACAQLMADTRFDYERHLDAVARGDHESFLALYHQESAHMLALAGQLLGGRHDDAQDVLGDTFVLLWKHADSYDPALGSARAWMYSILRHRTLQVLRHPGPAATSARATFAALPAEPRSGPRRHALGRLSAAQRQALSMAYYRGYTYPDIAHHCRLAVSRVQEDVRAALSQIREAGRP